MMQLDDRGAAYRVTKIKVTAHRMGACRRHVTSEREHTGIDGHDNDKIDDDGGGGGGDGRKMHLAKW